MSCKIELFGHNNCPSCIQIKDSFEKANIKFNYVDVFNNPDYANDLGIRSVPTIIINDQMFINPEQSIIINIIKDNDNVM